VNRSDSMIRNKGTLENGGNLLFEQVCSKKTLHEAFHRVRKNKGSAGVDNVTIGDYKKNLDSNLEALQTKLRNQSYKPRPVKRVYIDKQDGSKRPLGIPTVEDRVVQQAIRQVIEPIFERKFKDCSYGFRPNRNCHQAVREVQSHIRSKYRYVIDADLKSYFDMINQEILKRELRKEIADDNLMSLIDKTLKSGILEHGCYHETIRGATQGGVTSPLYGNVYLHPLDEILTERGHKVIRYADDFVILHTSKKGAERVLAWLRKFLEREYKLILHPEKTKIVDAYEEAFTFLGFTFRSGYIVVDEGRMKRFKAKIKALTKRNQTVSIKALLGKKLNSVIRGWGNYYGIGNVKTVFDKLMKWIRRRLRSIQLRSWKTKKKLFKALRKAGWKGELDPIRMNRWSSSKTKQTHAAMSNKWFKEQGLVDLVKIYNDLHPQRG